MTLLQIQPPVVREEHCPRHYHTLSGSRGRSCSHNPLRCLPFFESVKRMTKTRAESSLPSSQRCFVTMHFVATGPLESPREPDHTPAGFLDNASGLGGVWHKALVVGSVSLWRRLLASRP